nr:hypothetical protein [Tanacetum cinerariifolium]
MEPNSSLEKICLGDDVVVISSDKVEGLGDWNSPEYQDTAGSKGKKVINTLSFYKIEMDEISERYIATCFMNGLEAYDGKSSDDWDQLLDFNFDDVPKFRKELPLFVCKMGKRNRNKNRAMENINLFYQDIRPSSSAGIVKEEEEAVKRIKGEALKEKDDPGAFIFPIRLEGKVNENALADTGSNIPIDCDAPIVVGRGFLHTMGSILNTPKRLFSTFDGVCHQTFRAARFNVLRIAESDSDDEEEYVIKRNNVWKKAISFLGSLPVPLKQVNWKPDYKGSYTKEEEATGQWRTEIRLTDPHQEHMTGKLDCHDPNAQDKTKQ